MISESQPINTNLATVRATDLDSGPNAELEYSISQITVCNNGQLFENTAIKTTKELKETFKIDAKSGVIKTNVQLDRETISCYELIIQVNDLAQPDMRKSSSTKMTVKVTDENDCYPQFTNKSYSVSIREDINYNEKPLVNSNESRNFVSLIFDLVLNLILIIFNQFLGGSQNTSI